LALKPALMGGSDEWGAVGLAGTSSAILAWSLKPKLPVKRLQSDVRHLSSKGFPKEEVGLASRGKVREKFKKNA